MKKATLVVPWRGGIHMRPAAKLVKLAHRYRSSIIFRLGDRIADARSMIAIMTLCASMGTVINMEVVGDDEHDAAESIEQVFTQDGGV